MVESWRYSRILASQISGTSLRAQIAGDQLLLDFIAQDDMEGIGCLIGIDADKAAPNAVDVGENVVEAPAGDGGVAQMFAQHGHGPFPEGGIAGELLFNEQALAFMGRHAAGAAHGPVRPLLRQALLIEAVAGFMEDAHEGGEEFAGGVARGHAHVGGHAAAEGMVRDIKAAMGEIEADGFHHGFA